MAWDKGFNFRTTSGFVTDGTNETYVLEGDSYPTTRNSVTFGWTVALDGGGRDRDSGVDRRLAGMNFQLNFTSKATFRVDLPSAGNYTISLALGDAGPSQSKQWWQLKDNTTVLTTINDTNGTAGAHWDDATGTDRDSTTWPSSNASITHAFATTTLLFDLGAADGADVTASTVAHLFVSQVTAGGDNPPLLKGWAQTLPVQIEPMVDR